MRSLDGVMSEAFTHTFSTRRLRYTSVGTNFVTFNYPLRVVFNMPVDKEKTSPHIAVRTSEGRRVPLEVEYGTYIRHNAGQRETFVDQRVLLLYPVRDSHGRARVWDFDTAYEVQFSRAYPIFGTIPLQERRTERFKIPSIIRSVSAQSDRSSYVKRDLFDPTGKLIVNFYDEISIDRSSIKAEGLKSVTYGERCKLEDDQVTRLRTGSCEPEPDPTELIFEFSSESYNTGDVFDLDFHKLISPEGFQYNKKTLTEKITVYPRFRITSLIPNHNATQASVDHIYVCSNTPLRNPGDDGLGSYITASDRIVFGRWQSSRFITESMRNQACSAGEYQTYIRYGLLPETDYTLSFELTDDFGQKDSTVTNFRTRQVTDVHTRFHHLQKQYSVTSPEKTRLTFATENLTYMNMHICKVSPERFLQFIGNRPADTAGPRRDGCIKEREERIVLPNKYWQLNYFQIDIADYFDDSRGHYIFTFSHPNHLTGYGAGRGMHYERSYVSVTDLSFAKKELRHGQLFTSDKPHPLADAYYASEFEDQQNLYWVVDTETLEPVFGATVTQFKRVDNNIVAGSVGVTDREGIARPDTDGGLVGSVVRFGDRTAVVTNWADLLQWGTAPRSSARTYVYTDRPIYRPGQTVYLKGIDRVGFDGEFVSLAGEEVELTVRSSAREDVYSAKLSISKYGTFNTEFELPHDASLGRYNISAFGQSFHFMVEEYEGSPFKLTARTEKEEYISGDDVTLNIDAEYYFGAPIQGGKVTYSVVSQDYFFDRFQDRFFNFGSRWYFCYVCWYGDNFLFRGQAEIDSNGKAKIVENFDINSLFSGSDIMRSKIITYQINVEDANGRSVSTQESFILHRSNIYMGVRTDPSFTQINEPVTISIKTVDTEGKEVGVSGIEYTVSRVTWETFRRQEVDGGFYHRSEKRLTEVDSGRVRTDSSGNYSKDLVVGEEGSYEVNVSYTDSRGNVLSSTAYFYVRGEKMISVPRFNNHTLRMEVLQPEVSVGDTGSVIITTPYEKARALITTERGRIFSYEVVDITDGIYVYEFPITDSYTPNVYVTATLHSPEPAVQYGSAQFFVDRIKKSIDVDIKTDRPSYSPGDEVTLDIKTISASGEPVSAEVSIAVADLSVLALVGNPKKDPVQFFYSGFSHAISTASNLKNILHEADIPDGTKGGDGVDPEDLAKHARGVFRDTAFWDASIETDTNGRASVTFKLPDNLTTWQIEALAVTEDTKFGTSYSEFASRKELMVQPLTPRFLLANDKVYMGMQVFNQTDNNQTFTVKVESESLPFSGSTERSLRVRAGEAQTVFFETNIPTTYQSSHVIKFSASGGGKHDSVIRSLPMLRDSVQETVATAGVSPLGSASEYLYIPHNIPTDIGSVSVTTASTLRGFTTPIEVYIAEHESRWMMENIYRAVTLAQIHSHDNSSKDATVIFAGEEKNLTDLVDDTLDLIFRHQRLDGGFTYPNRYQSSPHLTMSLISILLDLRDMGYEISEANTERALDYLRNHINIRLSNDTSNLGLLSRYVTLSQRMNVPIDDIRISRFLNNQMRRIPMSDMGNNELLLMSSLSADGFVDSDLRSEVIEQLTNRVSQSGRGAVLREPSIVNSVSISHQIRSTASFLETILENDTNHALIGEMVNWLLAVRNSDQRWYSDELTYLVTRSLMRYINETEWEGNQSGEIVANLAGTDWYTHQFSPDQGVMETVTSLGEFSIGQILPLRLSRNPQGILYYDLVMQYHVPASTLPPRDEGISVVRELRHLGEDELRSNIKRGDVIVGELLITVADSGHDLTVSAPIPAGFTLLNFSFEIEDPDILSRDIAYSNNHRFVGPWQRTRSLGSTQLGLISGASADKREFIPPRYRNLPFQLEELTDSSVELYVSSLPAGVYRYRYYMRAQTPGTYLELPAKVKLVEFPEIFGQTTAGEIVVNQ